MVSKAVLQGQPRNERVKPQECFVTVADAQVLERDGKGTVAERLLESLYIQLSENVRTRSPGLRAEKLTSIIIFDALQIVVALLN